MTKTAAPYAREDVERQRECERALDCEFAALTSWAEGAGWSWQEISLALAELVERYVADTASIGIMEEPAQTSGVKPRTLH